MSNKKTTSPSQYYDLGGNYARAVLIALAIVIFGIFLKGLTDGTSFVKNSFLTIILIAIFRFYPDKIPGGTRNRIINYRKHFIRLGLSIVTGIFLLVSIPYTISTHIETNSESPTISINNTLSDYATMQIGTGYEYTINFSVRNAKKVRIGNRILNPLGGVYTFTGTIKEGFLSNTIIISASNKYKSANRKIEVTRIRNEIEQDEYNKIQEQKELEKQSTELQKTKKLTDSVKKLRSEYDDISDITSYEDKSSPVYLNHNGFYLSLIKGYGGTPSLRFHIQYAADDWLFIESYTIKADDDVFYIYEGEYGEIKRDNGYGGIWERINRYAEEDDIAMFRKIAEAKNVKIRFEGSDYYKDKDITSQQKQAIKNILNAYDAMLDSSD